MEEDLQDILGNCSQDSMQKLLVYIKEKPVEVDKNIAQVLTYLCGIEVNKFAKEYELLLNELLIIFSKLHRVQNFIAKLIPTFKNTPRNEKATIELILPQTVLQSFEKCIVPMASWQVINLLKTFLFHLGSAITEDMLNNEENVILYIEFLSALLCSLLSCVRMAEHSISELVLEKFLKSMEEIRELLGKFGKYLVKKEHNPNLMRTFLKIADTWAEVYITLSYYSIDGNVIMLLNMDNDNAACNITYFHSYLSSSQWALISQRIANFGEKECKCLMEKLVSQKIKAMSMFGDINDEAIDSSLINMPLTEKTFDDIIKNPYLVKKHISKLPVNNILYLAEMCIDYSLNNFDIIEDQIWISAVSHICLTKINKTLKRQKRKLDMENTIQFISEKLLNVVPNEHFVTAENIDEYILTISDMISEFMGQDYENIEVNIKSDMLKYLNLLSKLPILYLEKNLQTIILFYLFGLMVDLKRNETTNKDIKNLLEKIVLGILQHGQVNLVFIKLETLHEFLLKQFNDYKAGYQHIIAIISKYEDSKQFKHDVKLMVKNINQEKYLQCAVLLLNSFSKVKKSKTLTANDKHIISEYKGKICVALSQFLTEQIEPKPEFIEAYALALKHILTLKMPEEVDKLLGSLEKYIEIALSNKAGIELFLIILQNKAKIPMANDELLLKIFNRYSKIHIEDEQTEDFTKLLILIFENVSNDEFKTITKKIHKKVDKAKNSQDITLLHRQINIMTLAIQASLGPIKNKIWVKSIEHLLQSILLVYNPIKLNGEVPQAHSKNIFISIGSFCEKMVKHLHDSSPLIIDLTLINCCLLVTKSSLEFSESFLICINILEALLKDKKSLIMARLPSYLQQYRLLFSELSKRSNTTLNLSIAVIEKLAQCAHKLERLTRNLVTCTKDMSRTSPYLICDILKIFQEISIYPEVKMHLRTCLFSLISLCDKHAIKFVFRNTSCVEILKDTMENAKKYKYKGKI